MTRIRTKPIQKIRILLQRRARKVTVRALIITSHQRRIITTSPPTTALSSLDTPSSPVFLSNVRSISNGCVFKTPSVGGGAAVLRDAVGAFFEVAVGDFGEVGGVGVPEGFKCGDFSGDNVVRAGKGKVT